MGIKFKRSAVPGKVPTVGDLALGELAINTADGRVYTKRSLEGVESIVQLGSVRSVAGRSGDVTLAIADVANLQTALDGKAAASHSHSAGQVSGLGALALLNSVGSEQIADGAVGVAELAAAVQQFFVPTGSLVAYAGAAAPAGWLLCAGQAVSRATYGALYTALGGAASPYGQGDGSTTFNLPDLRGRVPAGKDDMDGGAANRLTATGSGVNGAELGAAGGAETHTLTVEQIPAHTHSISRTSGFGLQSALGVASGANLGTQSTGSRGQDAPHNNVQPTIVTNYIIKF